MTKMLSKVDDRAFSVRWSTLDHISAIGYFHRYCEWTREWPFHKTIIDNADTSDHMNFHYNVSYFFSSRKVSVE